MTGVRRLAAAEYALSNALYAYCDKEMRVDCMIRQNTPIADIVVSSDAVWLSPLMNLAV